MLGQQWLRVPVPCVDQWLGPHDFEDTLLRALAQQQGQLGVRLAREVDGLAEVQLAISAGGKHSLESMVSGEIEFKKFCRFGVGFHTLMVDGWRRCGWPSRIGGSSWGQRQ